MVRLLCVFAARAPATNPLDPRQQIRRQVSLKSEPKNVENSLRRIKDGQPNGIARRTAPGRLGEIAPFDERSSRPFTQKIGKACDLGAAFPESKSISRHIRGNAACLRHHHPLGFVIFIGLVLARCDP